MVFEEGHCLPSCVGWRAILLEHKIRHFLPDFRQHGSQDVLAVAWTINLHPTSNEEDHVFPLQDARSETITDSENCRLPHKSLDGLTSLFFWAAA